MTDEPKGTRGSEGPPGGPPPDPPPAPRIAPAPAADAPFTLIYLDVDDEITSAAARIRGANAERVALVLPYGSRLATSRINFRLLAREATERGKHIEVIGADSSARALAVAAGLSVHPSVAAFEGRGTQPSADDAATAAMEQGAGTGASAGDRPVNPEPLGPDDTQTRVLAIPRRSTPKVPIVGPPRPPVKPRLALAAAVAVIVAVLVGGFVAVDVLPTATIVLHPRSEAIGPIELTVEARPDVVAPDAAGPTIPAQVVTFTLAAADTFPATGVKTVETKATGSVRFSNFDNSRGFVIPAGTIVRTDSNVEFRTLDDVTLPRATNDFLPPFTLHPTTREVDVEAVKAGPAGNVGNNEINEFPKGNRLLTVTNLEATSGGASTESPQVSANDVEAAMAAIQTALGVELDRQVGDLIGVPPALILFPETRTIGATEYTVDPETFVGTDAADFDLAATAEGTALAVDPSPIEGLAQARLLTRVRTGWTLIPETIDLKIGTPSVVGGAILYPMTISGTQVHDIDQAGLIASIKGLLLADARSQLDAVGDAEVTLWPDWVTTIPSQEDRISLTLGSPQPSATPGP